MAAPAEREGRRGYFAGRLAAAKDHGEVAKRVRSDHEAIEEEGVVALGDATHQLRGGVVGEVAVEKTHEEKEKVVEDKGGTMGDARVLSCFKCLGELVAGSGCTRFVCVILSSTS